MRQRLRLHPPGSQPTTPPRPRGAPLLQERPLQQACWHQAAPRSCREVHAQQRAGAARQGRPALQPPHSAAPDRAPGLHALPGSAAPHRRHPEGAHLRVRDAPAPQPPRRPAPYLALRPPPLSQPPPARRYPSRAARRRAQAGPCHPQPRPVAARRPAAACRAPAQHPLPPPRGARPPPLPLQPPACQTAQGSLRLHHAPPHCFLLYALQPRRPVQPRSARPTRRQPARPTAQPHLRGPHARDGRAPPRPCRCGPGQAPPGLPTPARVWGRRGSLRSLRLQERRPRPRPHAPRPPGKPPPGSGRTRPGGRCPGRGPRPPGRPADRRRRRRRRCRRRCRRRRAAGTPAAFGCRERGVQAVAR